MEKKDIRQYLHYFLGGKIFFQERVWYFIQYDHAHGELKLDRDGAGGYMRIDWKDATPILHRLEDMAYDDFIKAAEIHVAEGGKLQITIENIKRDPIAYPSYPEVFHFLLSKGYDLFQLIEEGLAIDAKTIKI